MAGFNKLYQNITRERPDTQETIVLATLKRVEAFQTLSNKVLRDVAEFMHIRVYKQDEPIYYEGDPGLGLFIVQKGCVQLSVLNTEKKQVEAAQLSEHQMFGVESLFGDFKRLASAHATTNVRLVGFFLPDLKVLMKRHPAAATLVIEAISRSLVENQLNLIDRLSQKIGKSSTISILHEATPVSREATSF